MHNMPAPGFEPGSRAPQAPRISRLPHAGLRQWRWELIFISSCWRPLGGLMALGGSFG